MFENTVITVAGAKTENKAVLIALGFECFRRAPASHHPIVMGFLRVIRSEVVFGYVCENAQGFRLAAFDELHARVIFPGPERILARLWRILVLLSNERARISDDASKQIGPEQPIVSAAAPPELQPITALPQVLSVMAR